MRKANKHEWAQKCCICKNDLISVFNANNPAPINNKEDEFCCNSCNNNFVVPLRISLNKQEREKQINKPK
jgi:hypothetical protein